MPLFIQEIFIERLLSARRCWKGWDITGNQTDRNCPRGLTFVRGTHRNRLRCNQGQRERERPPRQGQRQEETRRDRGREAETGRSRGGARNTEAQRWWEMQRDTEMQQMTAGAGWWGELKLRAPGLTLSSNTSQRCGLKPVSAPWASVLCAPRPPAAL